MFVGHTECFQQAFADHLTNDLGCLYFFAELQKLAVFIWIYFRGIRKTEPDSFAIGYQGFDVFGHFMKERFFRDFLFQAWHFGINRIRYFKPAFFGEFDFRSPEIGTSGINGHNGNIRYKLIIGLNIGWDHAQGTVFSLQTLYHFRGKNFHQVLNVNICCPNLLFF